MERQRNHYTADFKAQVALAAIKGQQTVNEIAATYGVHPNQVLQWKKQALEVLPDVCSSRRAPAAQDEEACGKRDSTSRLGNSKSKSTGSKKSRMTRLTIGGNGSNRTTSRSACGGNANGSG